jgi:hypothetical protein
MDDITIGVNEYVNNILVTAQPNDQIIDIAVTETVETVLLDVSTTVSEVSVTATQNVIVENITVDYVNNENQIDINVTDATQDVTLNVTPTLIEINVLRSGGEVNILQFDSLADFPTTGSSDYFYLAKDTNKLYRWTGSAYAEISATANAIWGEITGTLSSQTDLQNALNLKAPINSPTFTGTVSGITKGMVGLGAVDNTSDLDKPISTATQTALNAKQPLDGDLTSIAGLSGTSGFLKKNGANSWNLDTNTYLTEITSSDVTTALGYIPEDSANKGIAGGYASLDGGGKVPSSQLPSYVDDVIEVANYASLPSTGETGKIYITIDNNKIYRWSGSVYVEISGGASVWGGITGTLSNQTDLQSALDAKQDDLNGTGFVKASGTTISYDNTVYYPDSNPDGYTSNTGTVTSVALSVPNAFSVSGSPITSSGTLAITGAGTTAQYVRGDGTLATMPNISGFVPYTGATGNVDLGEYNIKSGAFKFDLTPSGTLAEGTMQWNSSDGTVDIGLKGGNVVLQVGQETVYEVRNETGSTILNGTALYANGVTAGSGRITAGAYVADGSIRELRFLGLATEDISNGVNGFVTHFGYVRGLDTRGTSSSSISVGDETWAVGDILYVHPTVAGKLTNVKPQHEISVAIIITRHQSSGVLFVRPSSAGHLEDIHDVLITSKANNDGLFYEASTDLWKNKSIATVLGYTPANGADYMALSGDQSIAGNKTFTGFAYFDNTIFLKQTTSISFISGYNSISASSSGIRMGITSGISALFNLTSLSTNRDYTLPNASGTLALTSDIPSLAGYVPTSRTITINGTTFDLSADRTYNISTSDATKLPLTGGTLTGALSGTTISLSGSASTNALVVNQNSGFHALQVNQSGAGAGIGINQTGNTDGLLITHTGGRGIRINSANAGYGIIINNETASTSVPFVIQKSGVDRISFNDSGAGTFNSTLTASQFIRSGGTSSQFLKADGSIDSTSYQPTLTNPITGTGTTSYLPKFTGTSAIGNSLLYDTGSALLVGATSASDGQSKLELVSAGPVGLKIISSAANGNNTFLSIQSSKEWRFLTNRGDISGNQGDLIIRNNTDGINHIILNQGGSTTFVSSVTATTFSATDSTGSAILTTNGGGEGVLSVNTANPLRFFTNGGEKMRITSAGNVGIGTTSPLAKLVVSTASNVNFEVRNGADYGLVGVGIDSRDDSRSTRNALFLYGSPIVMGGGNVGIGTTAPTERFTVSGSGRFTGQATNFSLGSRGVNIDITDASGLARIYAVTGTGTAGDLALGTANTERMRITSGGNVGIGTTSPGVSL